MDDKKLFLLDAYALIYRAYYALIRAPRLTSKGFNTSAVFGFCVTLDDILRKENPSHIAVCFDPPHGVTFRHKEYAEYKAGRDAQPEDITLSIPYIKEIVAAYNIPAIEVEGFEADDVIGTLSRQAEAAGFTTYMMTPDKDYGQLVTDRVLMYRPALKGQGFEIRGPKEICERYGIPSPELVIDLLALEGDVSDNIPGCPGVGEKTAVKLIAQFGSVEEMLARTGEIKGALRAKVESNVDKIRMSKYLATIRTDVPVGVDIADLRRRPEDKARLRSLFKELEFRSFLSKIGESDTTPDPVPASAAPRTDGQASLFDWLDDKPSAAPRPAAYELSRNFLSGAAEVRKHVADAVGRPKVGVALSVRGAEAMTASWLGIAVAPQPGRAFYVDLTGSDRGELLAALLPLIKSETTTVVSHDVKRDMLVMRRAGLSPFVSPYFDTSVAHYLLQPEMRHGVNVMADSYLGFHGIDIDESKLRKGEPLTPDEAMACADVALRLSGRLTDELEAGGLMPLMRDVELPLIAVLADMEWTGVKINVGELQSLSVVLTERMSAMEDEAYRLAGEVFNVASPAQVGEMLFGKLKIDTKVKRTKTGNYSTTEETLEKYRSSVPLVNVILKIRALRKLLTTYINALPLLINRETGRIHTSYNQTVTATGRISSTNPNLQNIPIRTDDGREIRRAFIADEGCVLLSADYSQIELRLMADISGDPDMIEAFRTGADIHRATAAKIYHTSLEAVTDVQRRNAKTANFGIIYGISAFGLSERLGISRGEAKALIDGYFATYPHIKDYMTATVERAREQGYVSTVMGRKRLLPEIKSRNALIRGYAERNAINAPLQGSAADIIKLAMVRIYRRFTELGLRSKMLMQVHDELVFNVPVDELPEVRRIVTEEMQGAYRGRVALTVSAGEADNWLEAH